MAYEHIYSRGGFAFMKDEYKIPINNSFTSITWKPIKVSIKTSGGHTITKTKGFRIYVNVTLTNYCETDYINIILLLEKLRTTTGATGIDEAINVSPKYGGSTGAFYHTYLDSSVSIDELDELLSLGQDISLVFKGSSIVSQIPVFSETEYVDIGIYEGGAFIGLAESVSGNLTDVSAIEHI